MASSTVEPPDSTGKKVQGYCIVLDLVTTERNKPSWSSLNEEIDQICSLFSGFGYDVKLIRDKGETEIKSELKIIKDNIDNQYASLVFIVFDNKWEKIKIGNDTKWRPLSNATDLYREFDEVRYKPLRNKPKIFLRHSIRQATDDVPATFATSERLQYTFSAASFIEGPESEIHHQKSILIQSLVEIGTKCDNETGLLEPFSKVCTHVRSECRKLHINTGDVRGVVQNLAFNETARLIKDSVIKQSFRDLDVNAEPAPKMTQNDNMNKDEVCTHVRHECRRPKLPNKTRDVGRMAQNPAFNKTSMLIKDSVIKKSVQDVVVNPGSAPITTKNDKMDENEGTGVQGFCVLLDLVTRKDNKGSWKTLSCQIDEVRSLFKQLNYDVIYISDKSNSGIKSDLKKQVASITHSHTSLVVIWLGKEEDSKQNTNQPFKYYWEMFNEDMCEQLRNKPKILLQHTFDLGKYDDTKQDDASKKDTSWNNTFYVTSTMTGPKSKIQQQKSLFLESLVDLCRRYAHEDELIELFTKVCNNMEIILYNNLDGKESEENTVMQSIEFKTKLEKEFRFIQEPKFNNEGLPQLSKPTLANTKDIKKKMQIEVMTELEDKHRYEMTNNPRGICVIINISNDRTGSRLDELRLINLFEELMFKTKVIRNKRHSEICQLLKEIADEVTAKDQSFFLFLMGHGSKEDGSDAHVFYDIEGVPEKSEYIFKTFDGHNCENLIRRPKIFIVQTCFGVSRMEGIYAPDKAEPSEHGTGDNIVFTHSDYPGLTPVCVSSPEPPTEKRQAPHATSDTLIYNATLLGHKSYRLPSGSLIIKAVDEVFREWSATDDVHKLLNRVSGIVSTGPLDEYQMSTGEIVPGWQQPAFKEETLNKVLYMNPGFQKDNITDCYNPCAKIEWDDSVYACWLDTSGECVVGVHKHNSNVIEGNLDTGTITSYYDTDSAYKGRIMCGLALDEDKHLVLLNIDGRLALSIIHTSSEGDNKTWNMEGPLDSPKIHPIAICEVYRDAIGILTNPLELLIYNRTEFLDKWSEGEFHSIKLVGQQMTNASVKVVAKRVLVLDHDSKYVVECDIHGKKIQTLQPGLFDKPCGLTTDQDNNIAVVCADGLNVYVNNAWSHVSKDKLGFEPKGKIRQMCYNSAYTIFIYEDILDTRNGELPYSYCPEAKIVREEGSTAWFTKDHTSVIVVNNHTSDITEIHPHGVMNRKTFHCTDTASTGQILHGVALKAYKHLALMDIDGEQEVVLLHITSDEGNRSWKIDKLLRFLKGTPFAICEVQNDAVGIALKNVLCLEIQIHKLDNFLGKKNDVESIILPHQDISKASLMISGDEALLLNHNDNTIIEYNRQTKHTDKLHTGSFQKPCSLNTDNEGQIVVVCAHKAYVLKDGKWTDLNRPEFCTDAGTEICCMCCASSCTILTVKTLFFTFKDNLSGYFCPRAKIIKYEGSYVWFTEGRKSIIIVNTSTLDLRELNLNNQKPVSVYSCSELSVKGRILNGLSLTDGKHVVLVSRYGKIELAILHLPSEAEGTTWWMEQLWLLSRDIPIALCEIHQDAIGVLMKSVTSLELLIYKRKNFPGKRGDMACITLPDQQIPHASVQVIQNKIYLLNHDDMGVTEYNLEGEPTHKLPQGTFSKPCRLSSNGNGNLIIVCANGLQMFKNTKWSAVSVPGFDKESRTRIRLMCCDTSNTIFVTEELLDTSTVPLVPLTLHGVKPAASVIQLPEEHCRLWATSSSGVVAVGSQVSTSISLISENEELLHTQSLGLKGSINSGLCLTGDQHAVIVCDGTECSMRFVTIEPDNRTMTLTDEYCDVKNPVSLFNVNNQEIGVMCSSGDTTQSHIEILERESRTLTKAILIGFETIGLRDTACMCVNGYYYISSYEGCHIRVHDSDGTPLCTLGTKAEKTGEDGPGQLCDPRSVMIGTDNSLLVQCLDGSVHKHSSSGWSMVPRYIGYSWHILYLGDHIYSVYKDKVCVNTIMTKSQPQGGRQDVAATVFPVITPTLNHVTTAAQSRQYRRVWTDGEVMILGSEEDTTLTILNAECQQIFSHTLCSNDEADHVVSGSHIRGTLHAVIVQKLGDINTLKLHIVNIDSQTPSVHIVRQLDVYKPVRVIGINAVQMAVLGFSDPGVPGIITLFSRGDLSAISHKNVCYGAADIRDNITISCTGDWYISSSSRHSVYKLTSDGVNMGAVTTPARDAQVTRPGHVWLPKQLHHDTNMDLLVTCNEGIIHRKSQNKDWEVAADLRSITGIWDLCFLQSHMFTIFRDKLCKFTLDPDNSS